MSHRNKKNNSYWHQFWNMIDCCMPYCCKTTEIIEDVVVAVTVPNEHIQEEVIGAIHMVDQSLELLANRIVDYAHDNLEQEEKYQGSHLEIHQINDRIADVAEEIIHDARDGAEIYADIAMGANHLSNYIPTVDIFINRASDLIEDTVNAAINEEEELVGSIIDKVETMTNPITEIYTDIVTSVNHLLNYVSIVHIDEDTINSSLSFSDEDYNSDIDGEMSNFALIAVAAIFSFELFAYSS